MSELNGEPAAIAYAEALGVLREQLTERLCSRHPLMVKLDGEFYVRSVKRIHADHSIDFHCALAPGLALTIGQPIDPLQTAEHAFASMRASVHEPEVVLGCDCVLRRLELEQNGQVEQVGRFFSRERVLGFSTYGEQFNAMHVNQTFTGVALGNT